MLRHTSYKAFSACIDSHYTEQGQGYSWGRRSCCHGNRTV